MAPEPETITIFVKYNNVSKILCISRDSMLKVIREKFSISNDFYIEQYIKTRQEWRKKTPLNVSDMATVRIVEIESMADEDEILPKYESRLVKKLENGQHLDAKDCDFVCSLLSDEPPSKMPRCDTTERPANPEEDQKSMNHVKNGYKITKSVQTDRDELSVETSFAESEMMDFLKREVVMKENERDNEKIKSILDTTFKERREFIQSKGPKVKEIKRLYPILFEKKQLVAEFNRILEKDCLAEFYKNLSIHCRSITKLVPCTTAAQNALKKARENISSRQPEPTKEFGNYVEMAGALLVLPAIFGERICNLIQFDSKAPRGDLPIIVTSVPIHKSLMNSPLFRVFAEGSKVIETNDLVEAFLFYMCTIFIFDMSYNEKCTSSLVLIETLLLGNPTSEDLPTVQRIRENLLEMQ